MNMQGNTSLPETISGSTVCRSTIRHAAYLLKMQSPDALTLNLENEHFRVDGARP